MAGGLVKRAKLRDEYYVTLSDPITLVGELKRSGRGIDVLTFLDRITVQNPTHGFLFEEQGVAILPITTYDNWLKNQIRFKARNKLHKATKSGIELREVEFNDELINGIIEIYNESPVRQGKPFLHYGKDFETIKRDHETFQDRSTFIGAYYRQELIGFIKLVEGDDVASLMQIISKISFRSKAPTNALIAKAIEICASKGIGHVHYGIWGRGGLREFKISQGFVCYKVPRYYVPLTFKGSVFLKMGLQRNLRERLPAHWLDYMAALRSKWTDLVWRTGSTPTPDVAADT